MNDKDFYDTVKNEPKPKYYKATLHESFYNKKSVSDLVRFILGKEDKKRAERICKVLNITE